MRRIGLVASSSRRAPPCDHRGPSVTTGILAARPSSEALALASCANNVPTHNSSSGRAAPRRSSPAAGSRPGGVPHQRPRTRSWPRCQRPDRPCSASGWTCRTPTAGRIGLVNACSFRFWRRVTLVVSGSKHFHATSDRSARPPRPRLAGWWSRPRRARPRWSRVSDGARSTRCCSRCRGRRRVWRRQ